LGGVCDLKDFLLSTEIQTLCHIYGSAKNFHLIDFVFVFVLREEQRMEFLFFWQDWQYYFHRFYLRFHHFSVKLGESFNYLL
jgi:hypothetical protein